MTLLEQANKFYNDNAFDGAETVQQWMAMFGQSVMPKWTVEKPDYACVFVGKRGDSYSVWNFVWTQSEDGE